MCACSVRRLPSNQMTVGSIPLQGFYYFFNFYQTLRVCHALVRSCAIYRLCTVLSMGLNYPQMLTKPLRHCEVTQFFYALKLPILYIKSGEKMVFFSLNLRIIVSNFQQNTKETFLALARQKNSKLVTEFLRASAPLCYFKISVLQL